MSEGPDPRLAAADFLFALLDDIDTAEDMAKSDDKIYRALVHRLQRRRFEVASTDGYSVTFKARELRALRLRSLCKSSFAVQQKEPLA